MIKKSTKSTSECSGLPKSECNPPQCNYVDGEKRKYCKQASTRKKSPSSSPNIKQPIKNRPRSSKSKSPKQKKSLSPKKPTETLSDLKPTKQEIQDASPSPKKSKEEIQEETKQIEQTVNEIVLPTPIPVPAYKKVKSDMDFFSKLSDNFEKYVGTINVGTVYYIYLFNKYKSKCLPFDLAEHKHRFVLEKDDSDRYAIGLDIIIIKNPNEYEKGALYRHMREIARQVAECVKTGSKTVIIPLMFSVETDINELAGHSNVLIYRKTDGVIERFEPHGHQYYNKGVDDILEENLIEFCAMVNSEFDKHGIAHIRYKSSSDVCPQIYGLQRIEEYKQKKTENEGKGYCAAWSLFFAELALNNPEVPSDQLLELVLRHIEKPDKGLKGRDYLVKIIKGYIYHISMKLEKYFSILFDEKDLFARLEKRSEEHLLKKFNKHLYYLAKIEMKSNMDPEFNAERDVQIIRDKINAIRNRVEKLKINKQFSQDHIDMMIKHDNAALESLQTELTVYERFGVLKDVSPDREVVYKSKSPEKSMTEKMRGFFRKTTDSINSVAKRITFKTNPKV